MKVEFKNKKLERLEVDPSFDAGFSAQIVRRYRMTMQAVRAAADQRDLRQMKSLGLEKLKGKKQGQHSMRLNKQWRLIFEIQNADQEETISIIKIEDYH